jgi:hypothetical protein
MGREVRNVPANWDHPKMEGRYDDRLQPMHDRTFDQAAAEWKADFAAWERGDRPDYCSDGSKNLEYWEWNGGPPERAYYRPWKDEEATWFQVWETVSEGTPVTPPFATKEELVEYLISDGDFWQQKRWLSGDRFMQPEKPGYSRKNAEAFVLGDGYVPSMVVIQSEGSAQILDGINAAGEL